MRPNLNKFLTNHESNQEDNTFIPEEANKDKGADNPAPNSFIAKHSKKGKITFGDLLRNSSVQGTTDTGDTKFMDIEQYTKYTHKEDKGISPFAFSSNYELSRALNQSNWEQTGHVAAKVIPNTLLEFTGMLGNVLDFEDYKNSDDEVGNWLNTWAQEQKQAINEALPIYRENPGEAMDIGDYAWWMENGSALVESAAAFVGLGFVTGGGALAGLTRAGKGLKWLQTLGKSTALGDRAKKVVQGASGLSNMYMLNQAEGVGIAVQTYQKSYEEAIAKLQQENPDLSPEEIDSMSKDIAAKNAAKSIAFNRGNMILNATSSFAFLRTPALARQIRNSPALSNTIKRMGYEGIQESGEELVNLAAENYGMDGESRKFEDAFRDTFTMEGFEAGFLGFMGGMAQTGLTSIGKELKTKRRPDGSRYSENDILRERAIEQEEAKQRWDKLSTEEKLSSTSDLFMTAKQLSEMKNELDKIDTLIDAAREKGDTETIGRLQVKAQELASNTFNSKAYHAFSTGTTKQLEDFYKGVMALSSEDAEARELPENYKEKAQEGLSKLSSLEKAFNQSSNYLDSTNIYLNRANLLDLKSQEEVNAAAFNEVTQELEENIEDLGIDIESIKNEDGVIDFNLLSEENSSIVLDLESYNEFFAYHNLINFNKKKKERLIKEYANLTSDTYQKQFREDLKAKRQTDKKTASEEEARRKKEEAAKKAREAKEKHKKNTPPTTPPPSSSTGKATPKSKPPVDEDDGDRFELDSIDPFSIKVAELANRTDLKPETIVSNLTKMINNEKDEATIDVLTSALDYVQNKHGIKPAQADVQKDNLDTEINDFADFLENNSPLVQEEDLSPTEDNAVRQKIDKVINLMESLEQRGINTQNFPTVAKYLQDVLGKERFVPLFNDIKDIYNLSKITTKRVEDSYEDIFLTAEEKQNITNNSQVIQDASLPEGFYNYDNEEINELKRQARIEILKDQGYTVYKSDTLKFEGLKTVEGHNKLAHLDKKYSTSLTVGRTGKFNVLSFIHTKEDISNVLDGSTDEALLDFDQLNVGSRITLVPIDKVIYDDGTIVYADGRVEKNGEVEQQDANDIAPIGIKLNGVLLNKVFLHTTEWINAENIADPVDVKNQKNKLYEIRRKVLEAGVKGITTTVTNRTNGFPLVNADGQEGTIAERLPNVEIGIVKDDAVYVGENKKVTVDNKFPLFNGVSVAVLPVNKGVKMAMPISRVDLSEKREYIDSMLQAVRLYLKNDLNDERTIQLFDQANIDITTEAGLKEYLGKFIYLPSQLPYMTSEFVAYMLAKPESVSMVRVVDQNLEFGRGAGVAKGVRVLNRNIIAGIRKKEETGEESKGAANRTIEGLLKALDNTLSNNMSVNISKNKMNKKFTLPLITETTVTTKEMQYNDFVKDHLTTDMYSHTLSNGKEIYTIQANIEFDDSFAFENENKVSEEASTEALGEGATSTEETITPKTISHKGQILKLDFDEDFSPRELTIEQLQEFEDTTPSSLLVPGVPIKTQTAIIDYLSAQIIEERTINPVKEYKELLKIGIEEYSKLLIQGLPIERHKKLEEAIGVLEAVVGNYNKLTELVKQNLLSYNTLNLIGDKFVVVDQNTDISEDADDDNDTVNELEENERNRWSSESIFTEDGKAKASTEVKLALSHVEDVVRFEIEDGKRVPVAKTSVFGLPSYILFDEIVNEVSGILAFNNYDTPDKITQPTLKSMLDTLEDWVDTKPYLHNVIEKIKEMPTTTQNQFVSVMSKHYTHHNLVYKSAKGNYYINNSDSNNIASVVQNSWLQNLINSDLIVPSDTTYILDKEGIKEINKKVDNLVTVIKSGKNKEAIKLATEVLNDIGIDFSEATVTTLVNRPVNYGNGPKSLLSLFTDSDGPIGLYLNRLNAIAGKDIQEHHPFKNNSALSAFAKEMAKRNPVYFSNSFKDVRGRTYYSYSANKFFIDRFRRLKTDKQLLENLAKQPFSANSYWLDMMRNESDRFFRYFKYYTFDGRKEANSKGKKLSQMSPAEHEESKVALFFSQNRKLGKNDNYIVNVFYPTTSDKGLQPTLSTLGHKISKNLNPRTGTLTVNGINWLYDVLVQPEINRILAYQANPSNHTTKGYTDGAKTLLMFPHLNMVNGLFIKEGGSMVLNPAIETDEELKIKVKAALKKHIEELVRDKELTWEQYGFIETKEEEDWSEDGRSFIRVERNLSILKGETDADAHKAAYNYVVNYLVANTNIMQTMITDPANYFKSGRYNEVVDRLVKAGTLETAQDVKREDVLGYYAEQDFIAEHEDLFDNLGKRLAGDIAPGSDPAFEEGSTFNIAHINDEESKSYTYEYSKKLVGDGYKKVNSTDAQEYTTLKEHLTVMVAEGKIDDKKKNEILALENAGKFISAKDMEIILQPMKPVYVNNIFRNDVEHRVYIKSSSFPLIRQLTRGLEIDKLRKAMLRDNVDRVAFDSAIKVGGTTTAETVFDLEDRGRVLDNIDLTNSTFTLPRAGFKIQQEVPYKEKDAINDGSQQRKLLTSAVRGVTGFILPISPSPFTGEQVQAELDKTYNKIYKIQYNKLVEEIGYDAENNTIADLAKLQKLLQEEGLKRSYPLYDLEGFKLDATGEDFIVPLWMNSSSTKVESMLNSIVDNRVRKFKPKGRSYVLGSSTGFRPTIKEGDEAAEFIKNEAGIIFDKEWAERGDGQLLNARVINGKFYPAEIMIAPRFKDDKGRLIDINKLADSYGYIDLTKVDESLLKLFGFRIPTQGLNSMSYIKVVGFLPQTSGDLLLGPADWTAQMGSDFDVDKLYTNSYNTLYNEETGAITRYKGDDELKSLENYLLDIHLSILGNPAKEVQSQVLKPLDFGDLGKMAEEIYPLVEDRTPGRGMSEEYQKFKYLNALSGKIGVGVFSNDSTFMAMAQGKGLMLTENIKGEAIEIGISLGGKHSNSLSQPNTNSTKGKTKADVIAAYQSLAVDNEKEQGMHKLNINSYTFDAIRTLAMKGFEEDIISYFLNQPIIRDYVRLKTLADDNSTVYTVADMDVELDEKYPKVEQGQPISLDTLKEGIKGKRNIYQQTILELFHEFSEHGRNIQAVQSAINTDSAGLGKDLFYSFEKANQVENLQYKTSVYNAYKLIGDYNSLPLMDGTIPKPFDKSDVDKLVAKGFIPTTPVNTGGKLSSSISFIRPTTINGFTSIRALMFNNTLWKRFFPYNNSRLNLAFANIKTITNQTEGRLAQNAELNQELFRDVKSFIIAGQIGTYSDGELVAERERLLVDTKENTSLGNILSTILLNGYSNVFLSRLNVDQNKVILPTTVQYSASQTENINERALYAVFSNMFLDDSTNLGEFNGIVYTPRKLAQDLVTAQLISGGVQQANQYVKYIPMNYLHSIGFYDAIKKLNFYNEEDFNQDIYVNQHIQHNPQKVVLKKRKAFEEAGMVISNDNNIVTYSPVDQSSIKLPRIFSIKNSKRVKGYDLYFKSEEVAGQWVRVSTLGHRDVTEYNPFNENAKSIVPDNNGNDIPTPPDLPTNDEELKKFNRQTEKSDTEGTEILNRKAATIAEQYQLKEDDNFVNKVSTILDKIVENNYNAFNTLMAKEIAKNLGVIEDFTFILTNTIDVEASYSMKDRTIKVNLNELTTDKKFEEVILEELIHALTKPAIVTNSTGAVNRLNGLRKMAIDAVKKKYGEEAWRDAIQDIEARNRLDSFTYNIVYPLINDTEFVGRLFKSKQLQEILNETPSNEDGKSVLQKFWDTIVELLNSIGLDIKKGSALEYATVDIISLINQGAPSSSVQGEMKKANPVYRTREWIENKFGLKDETGNYTLLEDADNIADFINANYESINAVAYNNKVIIEYDYRDLLDEENRKKEKELEKKKTKHFTYGGVTIPTDFDLGEEQVAALEQTIDHVNGDSTVFTIEGFAGTGKTTIIGYLQKYLKEAGNFSQMIYVAPTHAATAQLALTTAKLGNKNLPFTLTSTFYWKKDYDTGLVEPSLTFKAKEGFSNKVFIVDEASMVSDKDIKGFVQAVEDVDGKVIFMGDPKQIPDVSDDKNITTKKLSDVFTNMPKAKLNRVYRQNKSTLLSTITAIRQSTSMQSFKPTTSDGTLQILPQREYRQSLINDFKNDLDNTIYISYTNKSVQNFNKAIKQVLNGETEPVIGEKIVGYGGYNNKKVNDGDIANSIHYTITDITPSTGGFSHSPLPMHLKGITATSPTIEKLLKLGVTDVEEKAFSNYLQLSVTDSFIFNDITLDEMKGNNLWLSDKLKDHYERINRLTASRDFKTLEAARQELGGLLKGIDLGGDYFYDYKNNRLIPYNAAQHYKLPHSKDFTIKKGIDYGYGITTHKSQGMTVDNVYLDVSNIQTYSKPLPITDAEGNVTNTEQNALYYVGMSRASKKVVLNGDKTKFDKEVNIETLNRDEDYSPLQRKADNMPLIRSYQDRIRNVERNINKAKAREDFAKVEQLTSALDDLIKRYQDAVKIGSKERLAQLAVKGKQDMQEVAEFFENEMTVEDTLYIRKILHFWETSIDTLFDESERESEKLVNLFGSIQTDANYYSDKLAKIEANYMEDFMKKYGKATTIENVFAYFQDINYLQEKAMDISRVDNDLLNAVFLGLKNANIDATDEMKDLTSGLDDLEERVVRVLKSKGKKDDELFDLYRQRTARKNLTGDIVRRYSSEFTNSHNRVKWNVEKDRDFESYTKYMEWARNNTKALKLGYLFPTGKFTKTEQVKVDAYKKQLEEELGTTHYNEFMKAQAKGIESYNTYREDYLERLRVRNNLTTIQDVLNDPKTSKSYDFWKKAHSPYAYYVQLAGKTDQTLKEHTTFGSVTYIAPLPSKPTGYDDNFKVIEADSTLYEFYKYYAELDATLKKNMSDTDRNKLAFEGIPYVEKALLNAYKEKGMKAGLAPIWDELKKAVRVNSESTNASTNIDPVTDVEEKTFSVNLARNNKEAYDNYVFNKSVEYLNRTGEDATQEMQDQWHEEIVHELAQKKSYDLPKILRIYSIMVTAYKHKSKIEDYAKLAQTTLSLQREVHRTNTGEAKTFDNGSLQYKPLAESFTRTKNQFQYFMDSMYGGANQAEGIAKNKTLTSEEKKSKKELEDLLASTEESYANNIISVTEYNNTKKKLEDQIDELGGYAAWSKRGDMLLKYIQLKGMGWNVMSAIANVGFGTIANVIEGEGGQLYTGKQLRKAYSLTMGSIGRNATFNQRSPGESLKIRNMMERWDILKTSTNELYENPFTVALSKRHKWLSPYNLTERTEYINQAPLMVAMAMNTPVELNDGEKSNLWEVMNEEGNLKPGVEVDRAVINKLRIKIDQMIKRNHGNYDPTSSLALKKNFIGRALGQFRTWMLEGYAVRFEGFKPDAALGVNVKGRYISAFDFFKEDFSKGKLIDFAKAMVKFQTLGKVFNSTDFENYASNDFKDVDVANMRRMVAEVVIFIDLYIVYMLLSMLAESLDDDDENKTARFVLNSLLNQGLRLRTDITFYTSPSEFKSMLRDPIPAASVITDVIEWGDSVYRLIQGDDTIKSGVNSGNSRSLRETLQIMPLGTQGYRIFNYGSQQFEK